MSSDTVGHAGNVVSVLSPWVGRPAGLFYHAFLAMNTYGEFAGSGVPPTDEERRMSVTDYTIVTAFIMSAKDCLTDEVRNQLANAAYAWGAQLYTKNELKQMIDKGANMTQEQCDRYIKTERKLAGKRNFDKTTLYVSYVSVTSKLKCKYDSYNLIQCI